MAFAIVDGTMATPIDDGQPFAVADVQYPGNVPALWSADELAAIGVYAVTDDPVPVGKVATGSSLAVVDGRPVRHWVLADAPPEPVPQIISDRQFFQQLAVEGKITEDEALAAVTVGAMPAAMAALVAQLPADQQFPAKMLLMGATQFDRQSALAPTLGALYGMSSDDIDALWRAAFLL